LLKEWKHFTVTLEKGQSPHIYADERGFKKRAVNLRKKRELKAAAFCFVARYMKTAFPIKHKKQFVLIRGIRGQAFLDLR
jgi:hypothetical protein